ncbi:phosphoribosylformylglycinamidine synthase subunit PurS [Listeria fleischmannii 1991]|jgi:phosphoribosylformylglycinamidine synthase PurS subunit|uniref:Phosphoribosylformylglycinamidine synthase subunit PurS n=4 Tax=Listeria fleischmannii TaxID=1069827 RepID=A0A2X3HKL4_9LIST|nr:phosphoribosylformylglycinamidine synthase subunit PurS [Listeria fleischmannii]EIA19262.1 phosphoribosylformylglycinamidine synthase subunit PurS [Listeria fleischmannii subsp. coloradonensis]EMG28458.1 phosphoribosylformylglycinamidine synthase subunit PurS [Listeria fleischmannii subsp. fleischmannii LU2006-1]EUJ64416.1 phosphoribosylformylglycinamidine synthase subunit PurS [Listeria fleischmannii FSL S10-1203]KMT58050.1 phosphoribosylformylglycinamidine synthase subunit PurS [Listeria f
MYNVKIYVTLKKSVLDPQGDAVNEAANSMGYTGVSDVRIGKYMELQVEKTDASVHDMLDELCDKLLTNPVMEDYRYEIEEA